MKPNTRFYRRQWFGRMRKLRGWLIGGSVVAVVAFGIWVVAFSAWLGVHQVHITGAGALSQQTVRAAADVDPGTPLARIDTDAIRARVEKIPVVAAASVDRGWPQTLSIDVTRRQPVARLHRDGTWVLIDSHGVTFQTKKQQAADLPAVEGSGHLNADALQEIATVVDVLPPHLTSQVKSVQAHSMDSITLVLADGRKVVWGSAEHSQRKARVATVLLQHKAQVYDVSVPSMPTTSGGSPQHD